MINRIEEDHIRDNAYIPEHITGYVASVSGCEPYLLNDYLCYHRRDVFIFVGYPLGRPFEKGDARDALGSAMEKFGSERIAVIAPSVLLTEGKCTVSNSDHYYRLDLPVPRLRQKLRNSIRRALRELQVEKGREIGDEHIRLISGFLKTHAMDEAARHIFERIPHYISSVPSALILGARDGSGRLIAFDVAEFGARDYAFYMFNFTSGEGAVPGASDLLLSEVIKAAQERGKLFVNLGLGINKGVSFLKKKWGGVPFLDYEFCLYNRNRKDRLESLLERLV